jgi:hypothetical protein
MAEVGGSRGGPVNVNILSIKPFDVPPIRPGPTAASTMPKPQFFAYPKQGEVVRDLFWYCQSVRVGDRIEVSGQGQHIHQ